MLPIPPLHRPTNTERRERYTKRETRQTGQGVDSLDVEVQAVKVKVTRKREWTGGPPPAGIGGSKDAFGGSPALPPSQVGKGVRLCRMGFTA